MVKRSPVHARGFTLIEVMIVLALMGILTAVVGVSLAGVKDRAELDDWVNRIASIDADMRRHAATFAKAQGLLINVQGSRLSRVIDKQNKPLASPLVMPHTMRLTHVLTAVRRETGGELLMPCSSEGRTRSYALRIEDHKGSSRWLLVVGLSGQTSIYDASEVDERFIRARLSGKAIEKDG